jgi:hypothetical protein
MEGRLLREYDVPADVSAEIDRMRSTAKFVSRVEELRFEENARLQWLFGGRAVVCLDTDQGLFIVAEAEPGTGAVRKVLDQLPDPLKPKARVRYPERW